MEDDPLRLAHATKDRREFLGLSQAELATRAGVSESTIRSIEAARRAGYRPGTLRPIAEALGWTPDSYQRIRRGEEPTEAAVRPREFNFADELAELRREVAELRALLESQGR